MQLKSIKNTSEHIKFNCIVLLLPLWRDRVRHPWEIYHKFLIRKWDFKALAFIHNLFKIIIISSHFLSSSFFHVNIHRIFLLSSFFVFEKKRKRKISSMYNEEGRIKNNIGVYSFIDVSIISSLNVIYKKEELYC